MYRNPNTVNIRLIQTLEYSSRFGYPNVTDSIHSDKPTSTIRISDFGNPNDWKIRIYNPTILRIRIVPELFLINVIYVFRIPFPVRSHNMVCFIVNSRSRRWRSKCTTTFTERERYTAIIILQFTIRYSVIITMWTNHCTMKTNVLMICVEIY